MVNKDDFQPNNFENTEILGKLDAVIAGIQKITEINNKLSEIAKYTRDKIDNTVLRIQIGDLSTNLDITNKKLKDTRSVLTSAQHFLELIAEYTQLAKDGDLDEYKGHIAHLRNLAETALKNIEILGKE